MSKRRDESEGRRGDRKEGPGRPESTPKFYSKFSKDKDRSEGYERRERSFDSPRGNRPEDSGRRFDDKRSDRPRFERDDDRRSFDRSERPHNDSFRSEKPRGGRFEGGGPRREFDRNREERPRFNRDDNKEFRRNDNDRSDRPHFERNDERPDRNENRPSRFEGGGPRREFDRDRQERPRFNQDENRGFRRDNDRPDRNEHRGGRNTESHEERPRFGRSGQSEARNDRFGGERSYGERSRDRESGADRPERRENRFGNERGYGDRPDRRDSDRDRQERPRFTRDDNKGFRRDNDRFEGGGPRRDFDRPRGPRDENRGFRRDNDRFTPDRPRRDENDEAYQRKLEDSRERQVGRSRAPEYDLDKLREKAFKGRAPRDTRGRKPGSSGRNDRAEKGTRAKDDGTIRLNRYIANAGICSRRDADELIAQGDVSVNGKVITEMGYQVQPTDVVKYGNRVLNPEKMTYVLLNKPKDYITTTDDPNDRNTVMDLVAGATPYRIYPVGRLDRNTTGLLLLTNDGELVEKLTHPSNEIRKVYQVELDKPITNEHFEAIRDGIELEDGPIKPDDLGIVTPDAQVVGIEIHSGRNRIVRRIFEHFGYEVTKLDRTVYAGLTKKELPRGSWRYLDEKEVIRLKFLL
ncbi:pseudouridine synthase [Larkinella bovis]|uniref:Pseudouridine synthase n=1 Tax=Larkinella bovis TaxID=683041 RepID=A0ABW0IDJ0_9BACT